VDHHMATTMPGLFAVDVPVDDYAMQP
jgi:hypothetical protein